MIRFVHLYFANDIFWTKPNSSCKPIRLEIWLTNTTTSTKGERCYTHPWKTITRTLRVRCDSPVYARYLEVRLEPIPLSICEIQIFECMDYTFGKFCDKECNCLNETEVCDKITGRCESGCMEGYKGTDCLTECMDYTFGKLCDKECNCLNETEVCDKITGSCKSGCMEGYKGTDCFTECPEGKYGVNCSNDCNCKNEAPCDPKRGNCTDDECNVRSVLQNRRCKLVCKDGYYGPPDCDKTCLCMSPAKCNAENGSCNKTPCKHPRHFGDKCDQTCDEGQYLQNGTCNGTCHCLSPDKCDINSGECLDEQCPSGFTGPHCKDCLSGFSGPSCAPPLKLEGLPKRCESGFFGPDCMHECQCRDINNTCNDLDGWCIHGCATGYIGHNCQLQCQPGRYGLDCAQFCHCHANDPCDHINGSCSGPCDLRYMGKNCSTLCPAFSYGPECKYECHCKEFSEDCRDDYGHCRTGCLDGWTGYDCQFLISGKKRTRYLLVNLLSTLICLYVLT